MTSTGVKDERASILKRVLQFVPVISALVAVLAFVTNFEFRKKEVTCIYLGNDNLITVESGALTSAVKVDFQGKPISSLAKMHFVVKNTGNAAVKAEDVKETVGLKFPAGVQILGAVLDGTNPPGFSFRVNVEQGSGFVRCEFPLLNAGDEAYISVYIYNSVPARPEMVGRIVDIKQIENADNSQARNRSPLPFIKSTGLRKLVLSSLLASNSIVAAIFIYLLALAAVQFIRFKKWEARWGKEFRRVAEEHYKTMNYQPAGAWYEYRVPGEILAKAGIPGSRNTLAHTWSDMLSFGFIFLIIILFTSLSTAYMFTSPRGF